MIVKAVAFGIMGEFEEAERWARRSIRQPNAGPHPSVTHLAMLGHLGRSEEAELIKKEFRENHPEFLTAKVHLRHALFGGYKIARDLISDGLRKAGLPE